MSIDGNGGILGRIAATYTTDDSELQESVVEECMQYYLSLPENDFHIFCKSSTSATVVCFLLVVLAGFDVDFKNEQFNNIRNSVDSCTDCLIKYHTTRAEIRKMFLVKKKVPYKSMDITMSKPAQWEADHLFEQISIAIEKKYPNDKLTKIIVKVLSECLLCPKVLRLNSKLKTYFDHCFNFMDQAHENLSKSLKIYPGIVYFLFEGPEEQRNWALSKLPYDQLDESADKLDSYFTTKDLNSLFVEEYEIHFFNIQRPDFFSNDKATQFWSNMVPLLRFSSTDAIINSLVSPYSSDSYKVFYQIRIVSLVMIFINHSFSYLDKPLPFLLRVLAVFLEKLGAQFFDLIKPHTYLSFFDMAFQNPSYKKYLSTLPPDDLPKQQIMDSSREPLFIDLVKWMEICYHLLRDSDSCQFTIAMFGFMADLMKDQNCGVFIGSYAMENMTRQLTPKHKLYEDGLDVELTVRASARALVNKKCILLLDATSVKPLRVRALKLIEAALTFDITVLANHSKKLSMGVSSSTPALNSDLWNLLQAKLPTSNTAVIKAVFYSFQNVLRVFPIDIHYLKTKLKGQSDDANFKDLVASCNKHNKIIGQFVVSIGDIFNRLTEFCNANEMKQILLEDKSAIGYWSCVLSPDEKIYESGIGLLYEVFNVDGRLEALKEALKLVLPTTLESIGLSVSLFSKLELFSPTRRVVKIMMDLVKCLFDPIHGLLVSTGINITMSLRSTLANFWSNLWGFLSMIYKAIFEWSLNYEKMKLMYDNKAHADKISNQLLEFTRDVLDLSHSVLNGYKIVVGLISYEGLSADVLFDVKQSLLQPILSTMTNLLKWLRLSDPALLVLCVNLVVNILDLSKEIGAGIEDQLIEMLVKLCIKAKKFNNKMNGEQTGELLLRARKINDNLVENLLTGIEDQKKKRIPSAESSGDDIQFVGTNNISSGFGSAYSYIPRSGITSKQQTLGNYLKPYNKEDSPKLSAPKRLSMLETAKLKLGEQRKAFSPQPTKEPAAPRPSGFNKRKVASDSESESESDVDDSEGHLFTKEQVIAKLKRSKAALQSLQSPRFTSQNSNANRQAVALNQRKKAEELMRLRLNVDMNPLYRTVLSWAYNKESEVPVDTEEKHYTTIKNSFNSVSEYQKSFEPLLLLECWQSIQRAKEIFQETPFRLTVGSRSATDSFFDVYASVKKEIVTDKRLISDSDLVVLMIIDNLPADLNASIPRKLVSKCKINCFAKVREIKSTSGQYCDVTLRVSTDNSFINKLSPSMEIVGMKVIQMTTIEREYSSLKGLQYYDLYSQIIKAIPSVPSKPDRNNIEEVKKIYDVNDSQALAITGTVSDDGFSLIQGPPGTGKTKTILGVVGYFLTSKHSKISEQISPPGSKSEDQVQSKKKILICAPSNAAVDELVLRLMNGIKNSKGEIFKPSVVRLGKSDAINEQVRDTTLEELVDAQISATKSSDDSSIKEAHKKCIIERDALRRQLDSGNLSEEQVGKLELRLQEVMQQRRELGKRLDEMREQRAVNHRNREIERRNLQFKILNNAQVVCSTLSGSAHDVLAGMSMTFDTVVIDEAAQCIELSAIIPLRYGCKKCIMVGDPNQLPPTVLSRKAATFNYEQSLFVRMQNNHKDYVYLLNVQYRMHPEISFFPSKEFYNSKLLDGPNLALLNKRPWHNIQEYGPYRFFHIRSVQMQNNRTKSYFNATEAKIALEVVSDLFGRYPDINWAGKIGIISPYKEQIRMIKDKFREKFGGVISKEIDFNTVDGFQGQEKDIIIISCVRATDSQSSIGFLSDIRRMNVALTRGRASLWVLGSKETLYNNKSWRDLITDAMNRDLVTTAYIGFTRDIILKNSSTNPKIQDISECETKGVIPKAPKSSGIIPKGPFSNLNLIKNNPDPDNVLIESTTTNNSSSGYNNDIPSNDNKRKQLINGNQSNTKKQMVSFPKMPATQDKNKNENKTIDFLKSNNSNFTDIRNIPKPISRAPAAGNPAYINDSRVGINFVGASKLTNQPLGLIKISKPKQKFASRKPPLSRK